MADNSKTLEMAKLYRSGMTMQQIGNRYRISRQTVQQRLSSLGITAEDRPANFERIDKNRLESLYVKEKMPLSEIGKKLRVPHTAINQALELYKIPKRKWINSGGCRVDVLKKLNVGEKCEMEFSRKKSYSLVYMPAKKLGIRVTVRFLGEDKYEITRIS